ncbi:similar to Saccharomyces cerevisiae YIL090W ICE2 Integral ER membrane protein with type-III transmembrane domains [Geotrichum candidum]|uniref:Similar to Saccharomyces cerevisiae YIL090W ICE2 Integral ER membrane protein with type-III transmembrane domains n=1 Tax=Geotrichum candidum TaxID=1173061 RepID=A0A0J9XDD6_GEOCN|nr:similar to Saccharomyces cerevisiae YIL090W ICE2 Integral ER membrane protein with type-III transmembrane domains [Geotrichum candidum]
MAGFNYWNVLQGLSTFFYYFLILITIPLAFDVGGQDCGIAFTCTLSVFYFVLSTFRLLSKNTKFRFISSSLYHLQQIIIPSLLILHLSIYSPPTLTLKEFVEPPASNASLGQQVQSEVSHVWLLIIQSWACFVKNATPLFTTLEGFCTLLFIQTAGRFSSWLVKKSDSWMILHLLTSSCTITGSMYFLYRIYTFPVTISLVSAILIGVVLTLSAIIGLYGIISARGNTVESSLLFAYIVYCLYYTFTDFQSSITASSFLYFFSSSSRPDIPPLPPVIINGYTNLVSTVAALVPASFKTVFQFLQGAVSTVTPSVFVSLFYRLAVFFAATRIVPIVHNVSQSRRNSISVSEPAEPVIASPRKYEKSRDYALDEDDEDEDLITGEEEDDDDQITMVNDKPASASPSSASTLANGAGEQLVGSKTRAIQVLIYSYAPCILIAIYTHLLIQHLSLFHLASSVSATDGPFNTTSTVASTGTFASFNTTNTNIFGGNSSNSISINGSVYASYESLLSTLATAQQNWWVIVSIRDSWQFWCWVNMFSTLFLYTLELVYGKKTDIDNHHWDEIKALK